MPSKTIEDFAYQIKDYMRSAEVVEGKNYFNPSIPSGTVKDNITYNVNSDKSISANGTTSASTYIELGKRTLLPGTYMLSGLPTAPNLYDYRLRLTDANEQAIAWDDGEGAEFTISETQELSLRFRYENNVVIDHITIYPMICTLEEWNRSHTYMPYYVPVKDSKLDIADQQVLGAWNLAKNTGSATSSMYDVDFTKNSDDSITADGTNDGTNSSTYVINASLPLKAGTYYLSGGVSANAGLQVYKSTSPYTNYGKSEGSEVTVTIPEDTNVTIIAYVAKNATVSNVVLKPMISLEPNQPYVPHVMTNSELTEKVQEIINAVTNASDFASFKTAIGNL